MSKIDTTEMMGISKRILRCQNPHVRKWDFFLVIFLSIEVKKKYSKTFIGTAQPLLGGLTRNLPFFRGKLTRNHREKNATV